ncbi:MAG: hypothetical protein WCW63_02925 [Acholeplasmataceae bacterium]|jgi:hypothetical protein
MKQNNIDKYTYLDKEYFSTGVNYAYEFQIHGKWFTLDMDDKTGRYMLFQENGIISEQYSSIYEALDKISFEGTTLKQLLMETDFNFETIG